MTTPQIVPGIYEHYKGKQYVVLGLSMETETREVCVVYRPLYDTDWPHLLHRSLTMFNESVEVDGPPAKSVPRFRLVTAS